MHSHLSNLEAQQENVKVLSVQFIAILGISVGLTVCQKHFLDLM